MEFLTTAEAALATKHHPETIAQEGRILARRTQVPERLGGRRAVPSRRRAGGCRMTHEQIIIARTIAHVAHAGQVDKAGAPYIEHPEWVAAEVRRRSGGDFYQAVAAAWLHDVVEDSHLTVDDLKAFGVDRDVASIVNRLTRPKDRDAEWYYSYLKNNPAALAVKLADIAHNTLPERLAKLDPDTQIRLIKKYAAAREALS
jgi:(p)ppGpp synthase/HD superfamily hydrolase